MQNKTYRFIKKVIMLGLEPKTLEPKSNVLPITPHDKINSFIFFFYNNLIL